MRKIFFSICFVLFWGTICSAQIHYDATEVSFQVGVVDPMESHGGYPRTPVARPNVSLDGHTLYFNNVGYDLTLVLLDDEQNEVYSALVPAGATAVMLPSSLNGTYELQKSVY